MVLDTVSEVGTGARQNEPINLFREAVSPNPRQQAKIIRFLDTGDRTVIPMSSVAISEEERGRVLGKISTGELSDISFKGVLGVLKSPLDYEEDASNPVKLFSKVGNGDYSHQILRVFGLGSDSPRDVVDATTVSRLLSIYPDPMSFEKRFDRWLDTIDDPIQKMIFVDTATKLQNTIYGKKQEYWDQIKLLRQEALQDSNEVADLSTQDDFKIEEVNEEDALSLMEKVEIHADPYQGENLTGEMLQQEGLEPKYKVTSGETVMWFSSQAYRLGDKKRIGVVAYVKHHGKTVARSYYLSNSQGVWRYLPSYKANEEGKIDWYGKGFGESSINLPISFQKAVSQLSQDASIKEDVKNPALIFAGTARRGGFALVDGTFMQVTDTWPTNLNGNFYNKNDDFIPPQKVVFSDPMQEPDFTKNLLNWKQHTPQLGQVQMEVYTSKDKKLQFLFCLDEKGRAWIGSVEDTTSPITSTGLRERWIDGGCLTTPVIEYISQAGEYGGKGAGYPYVDMFENYLSKIPVIRRFLDHKKAA